MRAHPPRPLGVVPLLLLLLSGARGSDDACAGGHVVATATDVDFFPLCCVQDSGILMSSWQASGYDIAAFENLYVTVHNGSYSWPPSDYLIANAMTFVLERDDGNYYYFKYSNYPADYVAQQTPLSIGSDSSIPDTKVTLTAYAAGCAPAHPPPAPPPVSALCIDNIWPLFATAAEADAVSPSASHHTHTLEGAIWYMPDGLSGAQHTGDCPAHATRIAPSKPPPSPYPARPPPPSAPSPPSPPTPPSSPPPLAPREGMISWEPWMPVVVLGIGGPLLLVGILLMSIRCCNLYRMDPRASEEQRLVRQDRELAYRNAASLQLDRALSKAEALGSKSSVSSTAQPGPRRVQFVL